MVRTNVIKVDKMQKPSLRSVIFSACFVALLQGCGGGSGGAASSAASTSVSGVAAVGAPISSGSIKLIGANGATATATVSEAGAYTIDTNGLTRPILVRVDGVAGGETAVHYSVITEAGGTINANPVTTAIVTLAMGDDPGTVFEAANTTKIALLTDTAVGNASAVLYTTLNASRAAAGMSTSSDVNFLNATFVANKSGLDRVLDLVKLRIEPGNTISIVNKTNDAVVTVTQPTSVGGTPAASGSIGVIQSIDTSGIDTLGQSFQTQLANVATSFGQNTTAVQALFDANFKHGGQDTTGIIPYIGSESGLNGATILPSKIRNCTGSSGSFVCDAIFTIKYSDNSLESIGFPVKQQNDNTWKFYGNQAPTDASVNPVTWRTKNGTSAPTTVAGFNVSVQPLNNAYTANGTAISSAKVYFGSTVSGTAVATIYAPQSGTSCSGTNYMVINTNSNCGNFISLTDAQINTLRGEARPQVTIEFLDSSNAQVATYSTYLEAVPLKPSEVTDDRFATFTDASWSAFDASVSASDSATFTLAVSKSASVALEDLVGVYPATGNLDAIPFDTVRANTSFSVKRTANRVGLIAVTKDSAGRVFWYQRNR